MNDLTSNQRKAIASAYKQAKKYLIDHTGHWNTRNSRYICWAIGATRADIETKHLACYIIQDRIYPHVSVDRWVQHELKVSAPESEIQAYRHRWLDALIEEFSS